MRELFVYYRVAAEQAAAAASCAGAFQATLCSAHSGLRARRMAREPVSSSAEVDPTWMETYAIDAVACADGVTPALQAAIEQAAAVLQPFLRSPRRVEVFIPCAS